MGRPLRSHGLILLYHRIAEPAVDPWGLAVSRARFARHLDVLVRHTEVVPLGDLARRLRRRGEGPPPVALTFDDGYADNLEVAVPLLESAGLPATVFVATGCVRRGVPFWWDRLAAAVLQPERLPTELGLAFPEGERRWRVGRSGPRDRSRRRLHLELWDALRHLPTDPRESLLDRIVEWSGGGGDTAGIGRPMTPDEVGMLARSRGMRVGAHSVSHAELPALSAAAATTEIRESLRDCAEWTGADPEAFAYPSGRWDRATVSLVRASGVDHACAGQPGLVWRSTDPLLLPRMSVGDWSEGTFERRLRRWWLP